MIEDYQIDYDECTDKEFDAILQRLVVRDAAQLLTVLGVYEALSEHYNNEVLDIWTQKQKEKRDV